MSAATFLLPILRRYATFLGGLISLWRVVLWSTFKRPNNFFVRFSDRFKCRQACNIGSNPGINTNPEMPLGM